MKQRHSYSNLLFHLVFCTKRREPFISSNEVLFLHSLMKSKAHDLDCYLEEFGAWRDHVHLLIRTRPTIQLCEVYRQLKGFSTYSWKKSFVDKPFKWADGAFSTTVDPFNCDSLRQYIRGQARHHHEKDTISMWEPDEDSE